MAFNWVGALNDVLADDPAVLVTLRQRKGSAPRESGARMVVTADQALGSIGGGNLEFEATATAREMLLEDRGRQAAPAAGTDPGPRIEPYGLGPALNQCCGGSVELLFEPFSPPGPGWLQTLAQAGIHGDPAVLATATAGDAPQHHVALPVGHESQLPEPLRRPVRALLEDAGRRGIEVVECDGTAWWLQRVAADHRAMLLFGAGHVGRAVVRAMAELPFTIRWVDSRGDAFPGQIPANTAPVVTENWQAEVGAAAPGATYVVMTHSHDLDEDICHAILERGDFAFLGLIGSASKRRRFVHRLARRGIAEALLERMVCPVGLPNIPGKEPATIALSLAAQLMSEPHT